MTTFEVQSGGVTYEVEAPDQDSAIRALQDLMKSAPKPDPAKMAAGPVKTAETSTAGDVTKAIGSGLVTGTEALVGLPGDLAQGAHDLGGWAGRGIRSLAGMPERPADTPALANPVPLPQTEDIAAANQAITGFTPYEAKTTAGKFARTAAEFVPGAVALGGAGSAVGKALKFGVAPGLASETAGQATEGTAWEAPARAITAIGTGMAMGALTRPKPAAAPTAKDIKAQSSAFYQSLDTPQGQVVLEPAAFNRITNDIAKVAYKARISNASPKAMAVLKEFENMAAPGIAPDILEIEGLRRQLSALAKSPEGTERFFAAIMRDKLDDAMNALKPADIIAGDAKNALETVTKARSLWQRGKKAELIEDLLDKAKDQAGANYTSAGLMTAVKQKFRAVAARSDFKVMFNVNERDAIRQIVRGTNTEKVIRFLSKFDPRSPLMALLLGGVGFSGNPGLAVGVAGIGAAAKGMTARKALSNVEKLQEMVTTGVVPAPRPSSVNLPLDAFYGSAELNRPRNPVLEPPSGLAPIRDSAGNIIGFPQMRR